MRLGRVSRALALLAAALPLLWLGCGGGADLAGPTFGGLEITVATSGPEPDPDGYAVSVDGGAPQPIGINGTAERESLPTGAHTIALSGLAANCRADGGLKLSVNIAAGAVAKAAFAVACAPTTGTIQVTTTAGDPADPDGYTLLLDGAELQAIGTSATATLPGVAPGGHTLGLGGVAADCAVDGDNPRPVTVVAGETAAVTIAVTCTPPPAPGALTVTTQTSGVDPDADGYTISLDGGTGQPIATDASVTILNLAAGDHGVSLAGVADNCQVTGENPRSIPVVSGATAATTFEVTCTALPPTTGTIELTVATSGASPDPDGYGFAVDGGAPQPIGVNATVSVADLPAGTHTVALSGAAANCTITGDSQRTVTVPAGGTVQVVWTVTCAPTTGDLRVTISGLPAGTNAAVTVTGPNGFSAPVTATATLTGLVPGSYTVTAADVTSGGTRYTPAPASATATLTAGATAAATVAYAAVAAPTLNLRIDSWQLTQSVQSADGSVPLVANRDGYLRVFVVANQANTTAPTVRVRLYRNGALTSTLTVPAPGPSVPLAKNEGTLASSWNVKIARDLIGPGLAVVADVDPGNSIAEADESDNSFPVSGAPALQDVRNATTFGVKFVPVKQKANNLQGDVTADNKSSFLALARRLYPLPGTNGTMHAIYTTSTDLPLQPDDGNGAWLTVLSEVYTLRIAESSADTYYGVVKIGYASGIAGLGYVGAPAAIGYDVLSDRARVMAHEIGHTWNRLHSPCGGAGGTDAAYPYPAGNIGVFGVDMQNEVLKPPFTPDIMGYCGDPWVSDYTYKAVLDYRAATSATAIAAAEQPCLLVWGRIENGRPVLEPAFVVNSRPSLPKSRGPYAIEGVAGDGSRVFGLSFDAVPVADDPRGGRQFAFAVPLSATTAARLERLRLAGPEGAAEAARSVTPAAAERGAAPVEARRVAGGVALRWDARAHPMVMVRDPRTGEVLSFARGGEVEIPTSQAELDVSLSDGVGSRGARVSAR
jgi:hypothetical protein